MLTESRAKAGVCFQPLAKAEHTFGNEQTPSCTEQNQKISSSSASFFPRSSSQDVYLPSVAEVDNIHVGLLNVPVQILRTVLLLQVHGEGQLIGLPGGLQTQADASSNINVLSEDKMLFSLSFFYTEPLVTDEMATRHSKPPPPPLIFISHQGDADSPAAHAPHLVR